MKEVRTTPAFFKVDSTVSLVNGTPGRTRLESQSSGCPRTGATMTPTSAAASSSASRCPSLAP